MKCVQKKDQQGSIPAMSGKHVPYLSANLRSLSTIPRHRKYLEGRTVGWGVMMNKKSHIDDSNKMARPTAIHSSF